MGNKTWDLGDRVSIRLRKKDKDVADYLSQSKKSISDEFMEALRLKISFQELEAGSAEVKAEHLILLQEFEKMADDIKSQMNQSMKKLNQRLDEIEKNRRDGNREAKEIELPEALPSGEENEVEEAMNHFGNWEE